MSVSDFGGSAASGQDTMSHAGGRSASVIIANWTGISQVYLGRNGAESARWQPRWESGKTLSFYQRFATFLSTGSRGPKLALQVASESGVIRPPLDLLEPMKKESSMRSVCFCLSLLLFGSTVLADESANLSPSATAKDGHSAVMPCTPCAATPWRTAVYRLANAAAIDVAVKLNEELQKGLDAKPKHNGVVIDSPVVVIPDARTNSLIVSAKSPYAEIVAALIKRFDAPVKQVRIQAKLTVTDASGKKRVVSQPQIITLDGQTATIEIADTLGAGIQLELTPEVLSVVDGQKAGDETVAKCN